MKHKAEGLKANGVWGFAFTPSTTDFAFPALPAIPAKLLRGLSLPSATKPLAS